MCAQPMSPLCKINTPHVINTINFTDKIQDTTAYLANQYGLCGSGNINIHYLEKEHTIKNDNIYLTSVNGEPAPLVTVSPGYLPPIKDDFSTEEENKPPIKGNTDIPEEIIPPIEVTPDLPEEIIPPHVTVQPDYSGSKIDSELSSFYGYNAISSCTNGLLRKQLYKKIYISAKDIHACNSDVAIKTLERCDYAVGLTVDFAQIGLTLDEAIEVWVTFKNDHPEYYWLSSELAISDTTMHIIVSKEYQLASQRRNANNIVNNALKEYIAFAEQYTTLYEKAFYIHNKLCSETTYALDNKVPSGSIFAHNIIGVFDNHSAVCEGYAKAYQLILSSIGIDNIYVTGTAGPQDSQTKETHSWNLVKLDDEEWHWIDTTWDDTTVKNTHSYLYFCIGDTAFKATHTANIPTNTRTDFLYKLPEASDITYTPVILYKNNTYYSLCETIDSALKKINDPNADYSINLCMYTNDYSLSSATLPKAQSIKVKGNYIDFSKTEGAGKFYVDKIRANGNITISSNLILEDIDIDYYKTVANKIYIMLESNNISFTGKYCRINADISGNDHSEISIAATKTHFYGKINVNSVILHNTSYSFLAGNTTASQITFADDVKEIKESTLLQYNNIDTINIGESVNFISSSAFIHHPMLENIIVDDKNMYFISQNGILFKRGKNSEPISLVCYPCAKSGDTYKVPSTVTNLGDAAFSYNKNLLHIFVHYGCTSIGSKAFANMPNLNKVYLPTTISSIANNSFSESPNVNIHTVRDYFSYKFAQKNNISYTLVHEYKYSFLDYSGNVVYSDFGFENEPIPQYGAVSRPAESYATYTFIGWEGYYDNMPLTSNIAFKPLFQENINNYTCTFYNADGTVFKKIVFQYLDIITPPSDIPQMKSTDTTEFVFIKWRGFTENTAILQDMEFFPVFEEKLKKFTYTFLDYDGKTIITQTTADALSTIIPPSAPIRAETDKFRYIFTGWNGFTNNMLLTKDISFIAQYNEIPNMYTYTFYTLDENGRKKIIKKDCIYANSLIIPPDDLPPVYESNQTLYFTGWKHFKYGMKITHDIEFEAQYQHFNAPCKYTFYNYDMSIISKGILEKGSIVSPPDIPERVSSAHCSYVFKGWNGFTDMYTINSDVTFIAEYEEIINTYSCTFINGNETKTIMLTHGSIITAPDAFKEPDPMHVYKFIGWSGYTEGMIITRNMTFTAEFEEIIRTYSYIFYNHDKTTIIAEGNLSFGETIIAPDNPSLPSTEQYTYIFKQWDGFSEGMVITNDIEFVAHFETVLQQYHYIFATDNATILDITADYGTIITPPQPPKKKGYNFIRWNGFTEGMTLTSNITFTAEFELLEFDFISDVYTLTDINTSFIKGIIPQTTVSAFKNAFKNEMDIIIKSDNDQIAEDSNIVKTGMTALLKDEMGNICAERIIIVMGDINCDGVFTITDFIKINDALTSDTFDGDNIALAAADINCDNTFSVSDVLIAIEKLTS